MADCKICGDKIEDPNHVGICYGCHLGDSFPNLKDYQRREKYAYDETWGHMNATAKPLAGVELLDSSGSRIYETLMMRGAARKA